MKAYSKMNTTELIATAKTLTAGITQGEWEWESVMKEWCEGSGLQVRYMTGLTNTTKVGSQVIHGAGEVIAVIGNLMYINDADAAFIEAAPLLVRELLARLQAEE